MVTVPWTIIVDVGNDTYSHGKHESHILIGPIDRNTAWNYFSTYAGNEMKGCLIAIIKGRHIVKFGEPSRE